MPFEVTREDGSKIEAFTAEEINKMVEKSVKEKTEGLAKNKNDILAEKKRIEEELKLYKDEKQKLEQEKIEAERKRATDNGDYKLLLETERQAREALEKKLSERDERIKKKTIDTEAMLFASTIGADEGRAELLAGIIKENYIRYDDETGDVVYQIGDEVVDRKKIESILSAGKYKFLIKGIGASGGGADGSNGGKRVPEQKKRSSMNNEERAAYIKEFGQEAFLKLPK